MATLLQHFDTLLLDLDGVCYLGKEPVIHAPQSLAKAVEQGIKQAFVTNNASRPGSTVADQLVSLGIPARAEEVVTAAQVGVELLTEHVKPGARVLVLGTDYLIDQVAGAGYTVVASADDKPEATIQGFKPTLTWEEMSEVALAIRQGALYICTNMDKTIPRERGLMVGNGSIAAAITNSTGVEPLSAGKPQPKIFQVAAQMMAAQAALAVGDNLDTDIPGAVAAQIPALHVLTGLATAYDVCLAQPHQRPTYLSDDLRALHEEYPRVEVEATSAQVGDFRVNLAAGSFTITGPEGVSQLEEGGVIDLDAYRALAPLCWKLADEGIAFTLPHFTVRERA